MKLSVFRNNFVTYKVFLENISSTNVQIILGDSIADFVKTKKSVLSRGEKSKVHLKLFFF